MRRREFLSWSGGLAAGLLAVRSEAAQARPEVDGGLAWYDVQQWGVEGKGWRETARYFDRLPSRAEGVVRDPVWSLSRHSAGMLVRFETDAPAIHARYSLLSANLAMPHMPATGVSGLDLYARAEEGRDRWLAVAQPRDREVEVRLAQGIDPTPEGRPRLYTIYLPLYNGTETLKIGVDPQARFRPVPPREERPIVFYGTSIMHGACASRPGMSISAILGRRLERPTINLGFSGNGKMEAEVGALLAELDPAVYAIDCLPNMSPEEVAARTEPLVRQLRKARPQTPILLVEDRTFTQARFHRNVREQHAQRRAALRESYERLVKDGVRRLGYLRGEELLGDDGEAATDGSHPNDLGMVRYADAYERPLRRLLRS
ncbi:MAG: SGNH/GDSL hydrolase family protein [Armatimonadota bacterium]